MHAEGWGLLRSSAQGWNKVKKKKKKRVLVCPNLEQLDRVVPAYVSPLSLRVGLKMSTAVQDRGNEVRERET